MALGWSFELDFVHIVDKVGKPHESRRSLILREVRANSAWVATRSGVQKHAEVIVINFVVAASDFPEELFHVDGELELLLNDLDQRFLGYRSLLIGTAAERDEAVQIFIRFIILLILQFQFFKISQRLKHHFQVNHLCTSFVQIPVQLLDLFVWQVVTADL